MCTVSYLPKENNDFVFTSNRDEAVSRITIPPRLYEGGGFKVVCPKDGVADGTWIGISSKNRLVCLLNGAFEKHLRKAKYKHSRGKVVKDFLEVDDYKKLLCDYDLVGVEPFTLLVIDWSISLTVYELVWDENEKHITELDATKPRIWSSSTLYTKEMRDVRTQWFLDYFSNKDFTRQNALDFHVNYGVGDKDLDLQIDRGGLKTVSVTNVVKQDFNVDMFYKDLINNEEYLESLNSEVAYG